MSYKPMREQMREKYSQMSKEELVNILLNRDSREHEWCDDMHHLLEVFIDVISHKKATISGQFAYKPNKWAEFGVGPENTLTREITRTDSLSFSGFEFFINSTMPENDPDFKARERQYYDVDFPREYEEHKQKRIQQLIDDYIKEHHYKPNEGEKAKFKKDVEYNMSRFFNPGTIVPSTYPKLNTISSETSDERKDSDLDDFIKWLRSIDITLVRHYMPDNSIYEWKNLSLKTWKQLNKKTNE